MLESKITCDAGEAARTQRRAEGSTFGSCRHSEAERADLLDLVEVLLAHPEGLRRWSIMRAIRTRRERAGEEVSPRLEGEVERAFRRHCAGDPMLGDLKAGCAAGNALFYRPKERAGEVWAVNQHRTRAWIEAETGADHIDAR